MKKLVLVALIWHLPVSMAIAAGTSVQPSVERSEDRREISYRPLSYPLWEMSVCVENGRRSVLFPLEHELQKYCAAVDMEKGMGRFSNHKMALTFGEVKRASYLLIGVPLDNAGRRILDKLIWRTTACTIDAVCACGDRNQRRMVRYVRDILKRLGDNASSMEIESVASVVVGREQARVIDMCDPRLG